MNIASCFSRLVARVQPTEEDKLLASQHLSAIRARLGAAFNVRRPLTSGSFARGTFNRGGSDVDLFAVISRKDVTHGGSIISSARVLDHIRQELLQRYPTTPVRRDLQATVVSFSKGASVDVVPAVFDQMLNGKWPLYLIPDGDGDWMRTCPDLHNRYIATANEKSGGKLRRVAQLLKYWRECRNPRVPVSSFHLEIVLGAEEVCVGPKSYAACVTEALQILAQRECRGLKDPLGISGYIPAVKSEAQRENALASIRHSRDHAKEACWLEYSGKVHEAWKQWDIVFNYTFPK